MISSPCSAEQAQRIKLYSRKSPPQSFPPIAQQAPGHFVRGLCCSRAAQPAAEAAGARPASNEIHTESPRTTVRGLPMRFIQNPPRSRSHTAAGELEGARPASNEIRSFLWPVLPAIKKTPTYVEAKTSAPAGRNLSVCREHTTLRRAVQGTNVSTRHICGCKRRENMAYCKQLCAGRCRP